MTRKKIFWLLFPALLIFVLACNLTAATSGPSVPAAGETLTSSPIVPPSESATPGAATATAGATATGTATASPVFNGAAPGNPPAKSWWMDDITEKPDGHGGSAAGGDNFSENQFERPFNLDKTYRPDLDLLGGMISKDSTWFYVTLQLAGPKTTDQKLDANYGVELDLNLDGRGDYVIWALPPFTAQWTRTNTKIYASSANSVGGAHPVLSDPPPAGPSYDKVLFDGATDFTNNDAWVRVSSISPNDIEIAFNQQTIGGPAKFVWGVWADDGIKDPSKFDYDDQYTSADAGSPYSNNANYPPKAIFAVDNTCRMWYGFNPTSSDNIPGSCIQPATPTPKPTNTPKPIIPSKTKTVEAPV